jgi:AcrR family transcriptional regulator
VSSEGRLEGEALFAHPLTGALFELIRERGYKSVDIEEVLGRAGMSEEEFDRNFDDVADLTLRAFESHSADFKARTQRAFDGVDTWPDNMRAAAYETARWIRDNPDGTWFGMVGSLGAPDRVLLHREETFKWAVGLIEAGRSVAPDPDAVLAAAPLIAMGAIVETLRRQQEGSVDVDIVATVPEMMYAAVRPYLGEAAARRELEIPPPPDLRPEAR